jgi:methionine-rich copper-binding protein CopC
MIKIMKRNRFFTVLFAAAFLFWATPVPTWAHAFPDHSEPRVGSTVKTPPAMVRIWFDASLEPAFSSIHVMNAENQPVDKGDGHVDDRDNTILVASLSSLPAGKYRVFWVAVSVDTHRTEGDFSFTVEGSQ